MANVDWTEKVARGLWANSIMFVGPRQYRQNLVDYAESIPTELIELARECPNYLIMIMQNEVQFLPEDWSQRVNLLSRDISQDPMVYNLQLMRVLTTVLLKTDISEYSRIITIFRFVHYILENQRRFWDIINIIKISARVLNTVQIGERKIWKEFLKGLGVERETRI